jgi:hypothetical protein
MKRVAICLHGYYSSKVSQSGGGSRYIENNILNVLDKQKYKYDIFIHSFDIKNKDNIINKYKNDIKKCTIENQKDFSQYIEKNPSLKEKNTFTILSFLYSRKQSIQYALSKNGSEYDIILTARLDLGNRIPNVFVNGINPGNINFNPELNTDFIYSAMWNQLNAGYADHWFYSNSFNMNILSLLYDRIINEYWIVTDDFETKTIVWIDSEKIFNSNLILTGKNNKSMEIKYTTVVFNPHYLYKLYFIDTNLYNITKFV